ncbi:MAG: CHC2 zinc finger domain-containing protein, partial [Gammaproteobacteria bacterium]
MARIPESEIERLKNEISEERLVESAGVALKKSGKDWLGRCPFHEDGEPSLVVTPSKNLWHCFGCQVGGGPIDWVMKKNGVSFRHAVELLKEGVSALAADSVKRSTVRALPVPVAREAGDDALLIQVVDYYHQTLKQSPEALAYLKARGLDHPELIERFKLGYANRTLGLRLPEKNRVDGAVLRGRLQKLGIYRASGHEHLNGSLVVPILDEQNRVTELYGRKLRDDLREGTPKHLYLPGPHEGVWNVEAFAASKEIILCEALIDAMTFWCAGYRNVTASYGVEGFTQGHLDAMKAHGTERVLIAYDADEAGDRAAHKLAERLMAEGMECWR